jgi:phosphoribosylaminoimidazole (AIR) synthetase
MGCGFCIVAPHEDADAAVELLARHHPGTAVIGRTTTASGVVELPKQELIGRRGEGFSAAS